jgi:ketosteroid isomerase-like protein
MEADDDDIDNHGCATIVVVMAVQEDQAANLQVVQGFLAALSDPDETMETLGRFLHPEVVQEEFPNPVVPRGIRRDLAGLAVAHARGAQVITGQRFEILRSLVAGDQVVVEMVWTGTLKVPYGPLAPGDQMRAHIAAFFELRGGRIVAQRSYDCYEPWSR